MHPHRYLRASLLTAALLVAVAALLAILVDPYGIYGTARWENFNAKKPDAHTHIRVTKRLQADRVEPRTVIFGNSRVEVGFDPTSDGWRGVPQPVYNFGVPGEGPDGILRNFQYVVERHPLEVAMVGLDFVDFLYGGGPPRRPRFDGLPDGLLDKASLFTKTALSLDALVDSFGTLAAQGNPNAANLTPLGFNPLREYIDFVQIEGQHAISHQKNLENLRTYLAKPKSTVAPGGRRSPHYDDLRELLAMAADQGVRVLLFTYPYHADILESFHVAGLWPAFEDWKRRVARIVTGSRQAHPTLDVALWDFAGYSEYAIEPVPPRGQLGVAMRWYWEAGHFKSALGDRLLTRMLREDSADLGFGTTLTPRSLEARLAEIRRQRSRYVVRAPDAVAGIAALYRNLAAQEG